MNTLNLIALNEVSDGNVESVQPTTPEYYLSDRDPAIAAMCLGNNASCLVALEKGGELNMSNPLTEQCATCLTAEVEEN